MMGSMEALVVISRYSVTILAIETIAIIELDSTSV
jgi:hypothetical protein